MRSSLPLVVALLLLAGVTADFLRRVGSRTDRPHPGTGGLVSASRLRSLQGDHDCSFVLESFDGSIATLSALVTATGSIPIAEVAFESLELGHTVPIEVLPRRGEPEHAAAFRVRCRFRGVVWEQQEDRPGYCTDLAFRKRVLYAGCEPEDVREDSAAYPLWVTTGPGFEDLRRHLGGR